MATNPVVSMPDADRVEAAIRGCPFVVVSDVMAETDTVRHAHVRLPAAAWGEKSGTVTNSERRISRQRPFLPMPGDARPDWWIVSQVARRMGFGSAFAYATSAEIFAEHAALSSFENGGTRAFDIGAYSDITVSAYDDLAPFQWPRTTHRESRDRLFGDGLFFTEDGKARFVPVEASARIYNPAAFPLTLNTGRVRDHWHTMTRTGKSQRLSQHAGEPYVELHPRDAADYGISDADLVRVSSGMGAIIVRALISPRQQPGSIFVPMHWSDQFAGKARVDVLVPGTTDPVSGQPASKAVPARIERFVAGMYGFAVLARRPAKIESEYWSLARCSGGWRVELGFVDACGDWAAYAATLFGGAPSASLIAFQDVEKGRYRFACYEGARLAGALFLAPEPVSVSRDWAVEQLAATHPDGRSRFAVIASRPGQGARDRGVTICSCFGVGANDIAAEVRRGCRTVAAIGEALHAGTNCGSCRGDIRNIIQAQGVEAAE